MREPEASCERPRVEGFAGAVNIVGVGARSLKRGAEQAAFGAREEARATERKVRAQGKLLVFSAVFARVVYGVVSRPPGGIIQCRVTESR